VLVTRHARGRGGHLPTSPLHYETVTEHDDSTKGAPVDASACTARHGDHVVVHVTGVIDVHTVGVLRDQLVAPVDAGHDVVVDLSQVTFLDSTGLGVLVTARKRIDARGGRISLVVDGERVMKVFRITALTRLFTIHPSLETALAT
jgi:anti-sigma B factor antagonist